MTEPQKYSVSQGSRWLIVHNDGVPVATVFAHEIGLERAREIALMIQAELNGIVTSDVAAN
jgi:hypothetical protein